MDTSTTTIFEIRSMRDTIYQLMEDMVYKAGLHPTQPQVAQEVSCALQNIIWNGHQAIGQLKTPIINHKSSI